MDLDSCAASILNTNHTPDDRWILLFDVNLSLEIPIEDFDENWWPLVTNVWVQWNYYKYAN
ncbi:7017_t:CDS:1, partial [Gigaspora margarita]